MKLGIYAPLQLDSMVFHCIYRHFVSLIEIYAVLIRFVGISLYLSIFLSYGMLCCDDNEFYWNNDNVEHDVKIQDVPKI